MIETLGVGGSSPEVALASLSNMMEGVVPIAAAEYRARIARAQALMQAQSLSAVFVPAGTNLAYFTGTRLNCWELVVVLGSSGYAIRPTSPEHYWTRVRSSARLVEEC